MIMQSNIKGFTYLSILKFIFLIGFLFSQNTTVSGAWNELSFDYFSQEEGLPNNQIQCIFQDSKGWMWLGTSQGLSRFDGYKFTNYSDNPNDSTSLKGSIVRVIFEDRKGNLLVGTENGGLNVFDREKEQFTRPYELHPEFYYKETSVNSIEEGPDGDLWLGTENNILYIDTLGFLASVNPISNNDSNLFAGNYVRNLKRDFKGNLWIGTNNGLFVYSISNNTVEPFDLPIKQGQSHEIWEIFIDDDGLLWVGTYSIGVVTINPETKKIKPIELQPAFDRTETVRTISKGVFGDYWIGTRGGLYIYSKQKGVTGFYKHDERKAKSLINNSVLDIFHDLNGDTWIGTRGGVNLLAKSKQVFHSFRSLPNDNRYLNSSTVYAFWIDKTNNIWIGTEDGGINIYDQETGTYKYLMADENNPNSVSKNCIKAFLDDGNGNLWIGTFWGGVDVLNMATGKITHYKHSTSDPHSLSDDRVWSFCQDKNGDIWIGTNYGIDKYNHATDKFTHFPHIAGSVQVGWIKKDSEGDLWIGTPNEIVVYNVETEVVKRFNEHGRNFHEDSQNRYWIATLDKGIAIYSKSNGALKYYNENDGLVNNQALCIQEDSQNNLWISTSNGLSKFNPQNNFFQNFTSKDGLLNNQFSYGAEFKTENGEILFGGISGFNIFNPNDIKNRNENVPLIFTDLKIFNKSVPVGKSKKSTLQKSISETEKLTFNYHQNVFTLDFAALSFINSTNILYSYYLEGFEESWNEPSTIHSATYTNLNPGDYTLKIKRVIPGNNSDKEELSLLISILPPFWNTLWFRAIILMVIASLIYMLITFFINREKIKNELVLERVKAKKLHELDMLKLKFFTNISHEIRTPLTLILSPLEKLISKPLPANDMQGHLNLIHRNAKHLNRLINQLLDFRKLESGNLKYNPTQSDIVRFVDDLVQKFNDFASEKGISLVFNTTKKSLPSVFDPDKIEKILNNLLSNSFKFTEPGGSISVNLSLVFDSNDENTGTGEPEKKFIEITVKDTGQGISPKNIDKIFNRFFQSGKEDSNSGTGIGLALVKELVKLHSGKIFVSSKPGKGSKFTIKIPYITQLAEIADEVEIQKENVPATSAENDVFVEELTKALNSKIMLIVEDNPDVRFFIRDHFNPIYTIYEAKNGQEGWDIALKTIPDIIISDILMPDIDGYEFCKRIKNDQRTSHIPLLLLTALHSKEHKLKGIAYGADDFITKPFDISVLQAKIENIVSSRDSLKKKFSGEIILEPKNIVITSPDERFLQKAIEVVEKHISNNELDIKQFATEVGVSRMQLYRKLHSLTDMTVKEFIRNIRLKRAAQLLLQKTLTVSEITFAVGFKDLSHFRKCFRREFGMNATDYINQNSEKKESKPIQ